MDEKLLKIPGVKGFVTYLQKTSNYSTWRYIVELTFMAFLLKFLFIILSGIIFSLFRFYPEINLSYELKMLDKNIFVIISFITLFAFFETLTGQWLMIWISALFTNKIYIQILFSALIFSLLHIDPQLIVTVFPIGIILGWSFILYRKKSLILALWVTTLIHINHNLIATLLLWIFARNNLV
ncbi:hypothetical protein HYS91_02325 [Candidatus Daviesbacteria bacterium]|nr:hypothetical protein [Candidatus Daviesbacteria bacterium]